VETQRKRRLEVEAELADKKVAQLSSKLENVRDMVLLGFDVHIVEFTVTFFFFLCSDRWVVLV